MRFGEKRRGGLTESIHIMFAYTEDGRGRGAAGSACYNKFFLLHVGSLEGRRGVGGKGEGEESLA